MWYLTEDQKKWLCRRSIKVGKSYTINPTTYTIYTKPQYGTKIDLFKYPDTTQKFKIKSEIGDFYKGNFTKLKEPNDFYISKDTLEMSSFFPVFFIMLTCTLPLIIYNNFKNDK